MFACLLLPINWKKKDFTTTINISDKTIKISVYWEGKLI